MHPEPRPMRPVSLAALLAALAGAPPLSAQPGPPPPLRLPPPPAAAPAPAAPAPADTLPFVTLPPSLDRVLRDYERGWRARDAAALAALFTDDGFVLSGGRPPARGRDAIRARY